MTLLKLISGVAVSIALSISAVGAVSASEEVDKIAPTVDYSNHPKAKAFIDKMVTEHGFKAEEVQRVLAQAEKKQSILDAISRPAEKTKPWYEYRKIFLGQKRIDQGVAFWQKNQALLQEVSKQYQVEPQLIVAIIGVETRYGRFMGRFRVLDALTTLGFDYERRSKFFTSQLEHFFLMVREQNQNYTELLGSYAGAMGYGQFIPSSFRRYARDYDKDGVADIWGNEVDAIASVANYFKAFGWQYGAPVFGAVNLDKPPKKGLVNTSERPEKTLKEWARLGVQSQEPFDAELKAELLAYDQPDGLEHRLGFHNFYVITRYNRSRMYARAVWELSIEVKEAYESAKGAQAVTSQ